MTDTRTSAGRNSFRGRLGTVFGRMPAPNAPRQWHPEGFKEQLRKAGMTNQDLIVDLSQWLLPDDVPSISTVYRWSLPDSSGPQWALLPLICLSLDCPIEKITKPMQLRRNPFDGSEPVGAGDARRKKGRAG